MDKHTDKHDEETERPWSALDDDGDEETEMTPEDEDLELRDEGDIKLLMDFLADRPLSPVTRERVKERLHTDPHFRFLSGIALYRNEFPFPDGDDAEEPVLPPYDPERSWALLKRRIELEERGIHTLTWEEKMAMRRRRRTLVIVLLAVVVVGAPVLWWLWL